MPETDRSQENASRRVLVLFCEEGQGHASAAQTLAWELESQGAEVAVHDAMKEGLGWLIPFFSRDTYRLQTRWLRWSYGLEYTLFTQIAPTRAIARGGLRLFGSRHLTRVLDVARPDVVVSTHPAVTNVLGAMRARGELTVPTVATVTDFGVHPLWVHAALDMHLVMHERLVPAVEAIAGAGSARVVRPIVAPEFRSRPGASDARRRLGLPSDGRVAVVSGGGWGVGDLAPVVKAALEVDDLHVIALTGRNETLRRRLSSRFKRRERLTIMPFTEEMPSVLAAADVLIDATVGVTCLEAMYCSCPVVVYGVPPGHSRDNARMLVELGLVSAPASLRELVQLLSAPPPRPAVSTASSSVRSAAEAILSASPRESRPRLARDRLRTAVS